MNPPLPIKRTRVKIKWPLPSEGGDDRGSLSNRREISSKDEYSINDNGPINETVADLPKLDEDDEDSGDTNIIKIDKEVNIVVAPTPAPRKMIKSSDVPPEDGQEKKPPEPISPTPLPRKQTKSEKALKKKRKAAEVIASVLRKESKQFPKVATIVQESEDKDRDDCDVGSPWDSPPPPKSLEKVYIQHKYGFSVRDWCDFYRKSDTTKEEPGNKFAVDVALSFHALWSRLSIFSHGLVAGVAGCHALSVAAALAVTQRDVPQFVNFYHFLSLKIHFLIYVFTTLCIVSCFDRLDVGQSKAHLKVVGRSHGTLLVTFCYLLCLGLSLAAHRHTAAIEAYSLDNSLWDAQGLNEWTSLVTTRDLLLLLCWIFMSCSTPSDFLQENLTAMSRRRNTDEVTVWTIPQP